MSAIDNLIERATGVLRPDPFAKQALMVCCKEQATGKEQPGGFATQAQFVLELRVQSMYWANKAQQIDARRHAEAVIVQLLYDEALLPLRMLRQAAFNGDCEAVLQLSCKLESILTGDRS